MKGKIIAILVLMTLLMAGLAYAAPNPTVTTQAETTPGTATTYVGYASDLKYNVSATLSNGNPAVTNCTLSVASSYTANSSSIFNGTQGLKNANYARVVNASANQTKWNFTVRTKELEDSNDYVFTVTCNVSNAGITSTTISDASSATTIDNGAPITPSSLSPADATTDTDGKVTFSSTVRGNSTTGCVLVFSTEGTFRGSETMDHSGDTCTLTTKLPDSGKGYEWTVKATDRTNETFGSYYNLKVDTGGSAARKAIAIKGTEPTGKDNTLVIIVVILGVLYLLGKGKKKK